MFSGNSKFANSIANLVDPSGMIYEFPSWADLCPSTSGPGGGTPGTPTWPPAGPGIGTPGISPGFSAITSCGGSSSSGQQRGSGSTYDPCIRWFFDPEIYKLCRMGLFVLVWTFSLNIVYWTTFVSTISVVSPNHHCKRSRTTCVSAENGASTLSALCVILRSR